ncbi:MAG: alpha-glucosidase (family GH31 glycosyl hydrolase), partial [bacterium]
QTSETENPISMKLVINKEEYGLSIYKAKPSVDGKEQELFLAHSDAETAIYYKKRLCYGEGNQTFVEYSTIQAKKMPSTAKYLGFGEKGGTELSRNGARLTYFNFDNMRYSQIYQNGPTDIREPLYDSNPFFMEFNGVPNENSVYGIFIDNTSETFFDLGSYNNNEQYLFGNMYGDMDYYFFLGENSAEVMAAYISFVGTTKLKPRYILGNHQGCYGYENLYDAHDAVNGYRGNKIPLDGLHVDVDIQKNYSTFTTDENKYPADSFDQLKERGIKCSTNITPVVSYTNENYPTFESGNKNGVFVKGKRISEDSSDSSDYAGGVYYGGNRGTFGHYPDFARMDVRKWWGQQYRHLYERGLEMVWQDMTTPDIPDPDENYNVEIYAEKYKENWKIGDKIQSNMRSFPFDLLVTDNSHKKYEGEVKVKNGTQNKPRVKAPSAKIRNLYSYNLHKATYHGLNHIWFISDYTFTTLGKNYLAVEEAIQINESLFKKGIITKPEGHSHSIYEARKDLNYDDPKLDLGLPSQFKQYRSDIINSLKQSITLEGRRKNKRNFIIGRGGFTGMHRFAGLWTGDNSSSWDFLKINVAQVLALGIAGQSMAGQDIGGFERENDHEKWVDPELFIRWIIAGAFLPWFRNHYIQKGQKLFQEPYKFQDHVQSAAPEYRYMYDAVLPASKHYVSLRYKLLQVFYDSMFENVLDGMPISRAMFLNDDHDKQLFGDKTRFLSNQFFLGKDLLIAPILEKESDGNHGKRNIYLPSKSQWYSFKGNDQALDHAIDGGTEIFDYDARITPDLNHIPFILPMYARSGSIIPTIELEQYVGELNEKGQQNPTTINIYPGDQGSYSMYNDDGVSRSSAPAGQESDGIDPEGKGEYRKTLIRHITQSDNNVKTKTVEFKWVHNNYKPMEDHMFIAILHDPSEQKDPLEQIQLSLANLSNSNEQTLSKIENGSVDENATALWNSSQNAWYYNRNIHISFAKVFFPQELSTPNTAQQKESDDYSEAKAPTLTLNSIFKAQ